MLQNHAPVDKSRGAGRNTPEKSERAERPGARQAPGLKLPKHIYIYIDIYIRLYFTSRTSGPGQAEPAGPGHRFGRAGPGRAGRGRSGAGLRLFFSLALFYHICLCFIVALLIFILLYLY